MLFEVEILLLILLILFKDPEFGAKFQFLEKNFQSEDAPFDWFDTKKGKVREAS